MENRGLVSLCTWAWLDQFCFSLSNSSENGRWKIYIMFILCNFPLMTGFQNTAPIFILSYNYKILKPCTTYFPVQHWSARRGTWWWWRGWRPEVPPQFCISLSPHLIIVYELLHAKVFILCCLFLLFWLWNCIEFAWIYKVIQIIFSLPLSGNIEATSTFGRVGAVF